MAPRCTGRCGGSVLESSGGLDTSWLAKPSGQQAVRAAHDPDLAHDGVTSWTRDVVRGPDGHAVVVEKPASWSSGGRRRRRRRRRRLALFHSLDEWDRVHKRAFPWSAMGRVLLNKGERNFYCSGTLVADAVVLTAAHCALDDKTGTLTENVAFLPNYMPDSSVDEVVGVVGMYGFLDLEDSYVAHAERDWLFLYLERPVGMRFGWLQLAQPSEAELEVSVSGYATHPHCDHGVTLCNGSGVMSVDKHEGIYTINTESGSSGGPVWTQEPLRLVGLHVSGQEGVHNAAVLSSSFLPDLERAKAQGLVADPRPELVVRGIVCQAHAHCDATSFCSTGNRCFRCDACSAGTRATLDASACPAKCLVGADDFSRRSLDEDVDTCPFALDAAGLGEEEEEDQAVCFGGLCLGRKGCGIVDELEAAASSQAFEALPDGLFLPVGAGDRLAPTQVELDAFQGDANVLARARGYRAGLLLPAVDGVHEVLGLGSPQNTFDPTGSAENQQPSPPSEATAAPTAVSSPSQGGLALGLILAFGAVACIATVVVFKKRAEQRRMERDANQMAHYRGGA